MTRTQLLLHADFARLAHGTLCPVDCGIALHNVRVGRREWTGDADLDLTLLGSGGAMNDLNALIASVSFTAKIGERGNGLNQNA